MSVINQQLIHTLQSVYIQIRGHILTFTFMHLADAFIQSDLHCISRCTFTFLSVLAFPGNQTHDIGVASVNTILFEQQESFF